MKYEPLQYAHSDGHTDVCYFEDGEKYVTCGSDGDVRIWSTDETVDPIHICVGESSTVVRQKGEKLYVATSNNDIQILSLPNGDRDGVLDRFIAPVNHIAMAKHAQLVALACEDMDVKLIDLSKEHKETVIFDGMSGPCLSVAICPNSEFLSAASGDGTLKIWDIKSKNLLKELNCFPKVNSFSNAEALCRMDFEPVKGKHLAYPENSTVVIINLEDWTVASTLIADKISTTFSIVQYSPCGQYILGATVFGDFILWHVSTEAVISECKHEDSISICGLMWNPKGNGQVIFTDKQGQMGIFKEVVQAKIASEVEMETSQQVFDDHNFDVDNDDDDNDENAICIGKIKRDCLGSPEPELAHLTEGSSRSSTPRPSTPQVPLQSTFMPSSTLEELDPRYMCWNKVGVIRCYGHNEVAAAKSIEVEFHDSTFHNSMMLQNYQNYTMGSLSESALAVANSDHINVIPLSASSKEWNLKMSEQEEIVLIAVSENLVCFAMANHIIRICSIYGTQRGVVSIPGPPVTMTAYKNSLMIAYHYAGVKDDNQSINIKMITIDGLSITSKDMSSALGPKSTLSWLGFSDVGTPAMIDSLGMLSLFPATCNTWIPFCDTSKHQKNPGDSFFVTAVFESYQAVGGIKCKGTVYPGFTPRPTMCELPLEPPFAETTMEKTQMEMNMFTWSNLQSESNEKKFKETALKIFALACRNDLDERALELMEMLENPQLVTLGLKYASKLEKRRLAEKLMELANKLNNETENDLDVKELVTSKPRTSRLSYKKLSLSMKKDSARNKDVTLNETRESQPSTPDRASFVEESNSISNISHNESNLSVVDSQKSLFSQEDKPNPFLKGSKKVTDSKNANPLSLVNKSAGVSYEKENKVKNVETPSGGGKRKFSDSESDKNKGKQRKLDSFKFNKKPN